MKNKHAAALGKKGGKAGTGKAKARTPEQAQAAARARWDNLKLIEDLKKELVAARARADSAINGYAIVCEQRRKAFLAFEYIRQAGLTYSLREWINANPYAETEPPRPPECLFPSA
jgi:hypothetical protein